MTESSSKQIVNFSYLDKEAELYKESKQSLTSNVKEIQSAIDNNTKEELKHVVDILKDLVNETTS